MLSAEYINESELLDRLFQNAYFSSAPLKVSFSKRLFDIFTSLSILVLFGWLYCIIALLVKISTKGSVFYIHERIGKDGVPFRIYKFRTMYSDAEKDGPALSKKNDPRVTPLGKGLRKLHLDELPQFYNVLIGDMSVIGTRPERAFFIKQIMQKAPQYGKVFITKPGITSWGQLNFGYAKNVDEMVERLRFDLFYMDNRGLKMDVKVFFCTILLIISGKDKLFN